MKKILKISAKVLIGFLLTLVIVFPNISIAATSADFTDRGIANAIDSLTLGLADIWLGTFYNGLIFLALLIEVVIMFVLRISNGCFW